MKSLVTFTAVLCFFCGMSALNVSAQTLLNEIEVDPAGTDNPCEYIELKGTPGAEITNMHVVQIEGDIGENPGVATAVVTFGSPGPVFGSNGLLVVTGTQACGTRTYPAETTLISTPFLDTAGGVLQNGSNSILLISSTTAITPNTDYDADNNGTLEGLPAGATIVDSVAWTDGGAGDITYGGVVLSATGGTIGACTRFPGNTGANSANAWYAGAMTGTNDSLTYSPTIRTANFPAGGALTPGAPNAGPFRHVNADFDGDAKTDFTLVRGTGTPFSGSLAAGAPTSTTNREKFLFRVQHPDLISLTAGSAPQYWYTLGSLGGVTISQWGDAITDTNVPGDFDGDGKDDIAVWRRGAAGSALFFILASSDNTVRLVPLGDMVSDPSVVADYDGDGKDDPAVYGCPDGGGQCFYSYVGSLNNPSGNVTAVPWGVGFPGDFLPDVGDFDGDGKADFCVQRADPADPSRAQFATLRSSDMTEEYGDWGLPTDFVIPGDFDGDGHADLMVMRNSGGSLLYFLETRSGTIRIDTWGVPGDIPVPGDYDGDGKTDLAVWRHSATPGQSLFFVYRSSDGAVQIVAWGQCATAPCDLALANWQVH